MDGRAHLIITVHGIRTFGNWQERLEALLPRGRKHEPPTVLHYKFGYFSLLAFFIPIARALVIRAFRRRFVETVSLLGPERIDIVAHSFGSLIVVKALRALARREACPPIHTIIFAGSVVSRSFDWAPIPVTRVANDCGVRDFFAAAGRWLVPLIGDAGFAGFHGFRGETRRDRWFSVGHSGFFTDAFMRGHWLPLLVHEGPIPASDARQELGRLHHAIVSFAIAATPFKWSLLLVVAAMVGLQFNAWRNVSRADHNAWAAASMLGSDPTASLRVAVDAYRLKPTEAAYSALLNAYHGAPLYRIVARGDRPVTLVQIMDGGKAILAGPIAKRYLLLALPDGKVRASFASVIAASRDAILVHSGDEIRIVTTRGTVLHAWRAPAPEAADFTAEGRVVTGDQGGRICVHEPAAAERCWEAHAPHAVHSVRFSADGRRIVSASIDNSVRVWDVSGTQLGRLDGNADARPRSAAIRSRIVSFGPAGEWETDYRNESGEWPSALGGRHAFLDARFLETDIVGAAGTDGRVILWRLSDGKTHAIAAHGDWVTAVRAYHGSHIFLTASYDGRARVWHGNSSSVMLAGHRGGILAADLDTSAKMWVTGGEDGTVRVWRMSVRAPDVARNVSPAGFGRTTFLSERYLLTHSRSGELRTMNVPGVAPMYSRDAQLRLIDTSDPEELLVDETSLTDYAAVDGTPDGQLFAGTPRWQSWIHLMPMDGNDQQLDTKQWNVLALAFSSDGRLLASGAQDGSVAIWSIAEAKVAERYQARKSAAVAVALSAKRQRLAAGFEDGKVLVWSRTEKRVIAELDVGKVESVRFSPDGTRIVAASPKGSAVVLTIGGSKRTLEIGKPVREALSSPDGRLIATRSDEDVVLWSMSGARLFEINSADIVAITFSADGKRLLTAHRDGNVHAWTIDGADVLALALHALRNEIGAQP